MLALQELEKAWTESEAACLARSRGWPKSSGPRSFSSKTCLDSGRAVWTELSANYPPEGMTVAGVCYPLRMSEPPICEKDGFCWPTIRASDGKKGGPGQRFGNGSLSLPAAAAMFPTPIASPYGYNQGGAAGRIGTKRPSLEMMAKANLWPTPTVYGNNQNKMQGGSHLIGLATAVRMWPTPLARDWKSGSLATKGNSRPLSEAVGGSLNPEFCEWLMGVPIGWTELQPWVTARFLSRRGKRLKV